MYEILENKQVMQQTKTSTYEIWKPIGMESEVKKIETEIETIYKHTKFNIKTGKWEDDLTNTTLITVNDKGIIPIDGKIKIVKV